MKFLSIYKTVERNTPPTEQEMATMGKLIEQGLKEGSLLATEGCLPSKLGARVRRSGSNISVTDGPFTESKEVVGGYALVETKTREEALALAREFMELHRVHWPAFECVSEVRQVEDF